MLSQQSSRCQSLFLCSYAAGGSASATAQRNWCTVSYAARLSLLSIVERICRASKDLKRTPEAQCTAFGVLPMCLEGSLLYGWECAGLVLESSRMAQDALLAGDIPLGPEDHLLNKPNEEDALQHDHS